MTSRVLTVTVALLAAALVGACRGGGEQASRAGTERPAASTADGVELAFRSEPEPPKMGQNTFQVTVRDESGIPVTDAEVAVELYMAAMPEMKMPEMRDTARLRHQSAGVYRGTGNVVMAGHWDVTVTATRDGKEIGRRTLKVTAQQ